VRQAIEDGRRTGHLTLDQADRLERELLGAQGAAREAAATRPARAAAGRTPSRS